MERKQSFEARNEMEKPSREEIKKRNPGPKVRFHDEDHKKHREANRRYYWRKKELS